MAISVDIINRYCEARLRIFCIRGVKGQTDLFFPNGWQETGVRDLFDCFADFEFDDASIAIVCGEVLCLDIDSKHAEDPAAFNQMILEFLGENFADFLAGCYIEGTPSGGMHLIFKVDFDPPKSTKIVRTENTKDAPALIETRGKNACAIVAPSAGYEAVSGDLVDLPTLSREQYESLISSIQKEFAPVEEETQTFALPPPTRPKRIETGQRPGDAFNSMGWQAARDVFTRNGWTIVNEMANEIQLKRPDNGHPSDAKYSAKIYRDTGISYIFTTGTNLDPETGILPFDLLAKLEHNGSHSEAAKALKRQSGHAYQNGQKSPQIANLPTENGKTDTVSDAERKAKELDEICKSVWMRDLDSVPEPVPSWGVKGIDGNIQKIATVFNATLLMATKKGGKSTFILLFLIAAMSELGRFLNIVLLVKNPKILLVDNEQGADQIAENLRIAVKFSKKKFDPDQITVLNLRPYNTAKRLEVFDYFMDKHGKNYDYIFIDGIKDFYPNFNDVDEAGRLGDWTINMCERFQAHFFFVLHTTKADGFAKGHHGSELENKAQNVIRLKYMKDPARVEVSHDAARRAYFDTFAFSFDKENMTFAETDSIGNETGNGTKTLFKLKSNVAEYPEKLHSEWIGKAFEGNDLSRGELLTRLVMIFQENGISSGDRKAKEFIEFWLSRSWIAKVGRNKNGAAPPYRDVRPNIDTD